MATALTGHCPACGRPARGAGGTQCWRCQKRRQRGQPLDAEYGRTPAESLRAAAIDFALADDLDDDEYEARAAELERRALALASWRGYRSPEAEQARAEREAQSRSPLPLLDWAGLACPHDGRD